MKANNLCIDDDEKITGKKFHKDRFGGESPKNGYFLLDRGYLALIKEF